jgi:hypothetical protein
LHIGRETTPSQGADNAAFTSLNTSFPDLEPSTLLLPDRSWAPEIPNPFYTDVVIQHPRTRRLSAPVNIPQDGYINGLIKVRLNFTKKPKEQPMARLQRFPWVKSKFIPGGIIDQPPVDLVSYLPPDFGRGLKLNGADEKLFNFCEFAGIHNVYQLYVMLTEVCA